jgi:signal transduction histidine kinase
VLAASDGFVCLTAADDGVGVPDGPSAGHGLPNMDERAKELGGELRVVRRHPAGTIVEWRVPQHVRVAAAGTPSWGDERS